MPRVFLAIKIPEEISEKIYDFIIKNVSRIEGIKPVEKENLHITLKFFGEIREEEINRISIKIKEGLKNSKPFKVNIKGIGVFPEPDNPRVIWIGTISDEIYTLKVKIDEVLEKIGFEKERNFVSHITIGRVKKAKSPEKIKKILKDSANIDFGEFTATKITFFESILTPKGPIYKPITEFALNG